MTMNDIKTWLRSKSSDDWYFYIKRLSANDTGASGAHQVGVYIPKGYMTFLFPSINRIDTKNPSLYLTAKTSSHDFLEKQVRAIYYNNKFFDGTRNEMRITSWGGSKSPLQDHENTGAIVVLAFCKNEDCDSKLIDVWVCRSLEEENFIETLTGELLPGLSIFTDANKVISGSTVSYDWKSKDYPIPEEWNIKFPSGTEVINYLTQVFDIKADTSDKKLLLRREAEYSLFKKIEEVHVLELIKSGFTSVDDFIALANSISNRRKSRSGKSLELHLEHIFLENGLTEFETQAKTENNKKPDFLFPSANAYHDLSYPSDKLRMLAVKTTCKDRWRQVLNEADRINDVYLFTLQEGVSKNQFKEMKDSNVKLVVPRPIHSSFHKDIRNEILSLEEFIDKTKSLVLD